MREYAFTVTHLVDPADDLGGAHAHGAPLPALVDEAGQVAVLREADGHDRDHLLLTVLCIS